MWPFQIYLLSSLSSGSAFAEIGFTKPALAFFTFRAIAIGLTDAFTLFTFVGLTFFVGPTGLPKCF